MNIEALIDDREAVSCDEVYKELQVKQATIATWASSRKTMFLPLSPDVQAAASQILTEFPNWVDTNKKRNQADPFVVGMSMVNGLCVVTAEQRLPAPTKTGKKIRIPNVCDYFKVKSLSFLEFIQEQGWVF